MSVEKIKDKAKQLAAYMLDVRPEDVTYGDGAIYVTADPSRKKTLAEVAFVALTSTGSRRVASPPA